MITQYVLSKEEVDELELLVRRLIHFANKVGREKTNHTRLRSQLLALAYDMIILLDFKERIIFHEEVRLKAGRRNRKLDQE